MRCSLAHQPNGQLKCSPAPQLPPDPSRWNVLPPPHAPTPPTTLVPCWDTANSLPLGCKPLEAGGQAFESITKHALWSRCVDRVSRVDGPALSCSSCYSRVVGRSWDICHLSSLKLLFRKHACIYVVCVGRQIVEA